MTSTKLLIGYVIICNHNVQHWHRLNLIIDHHIVVLMRTSIGSETTLPYTTVSFQTPESGGTRPAPRGFELSKDVFKSRLWDSSLSLWNFGIRICENRPRRHIWPVLGLLIRRPLESQEGLGSHPGFAQSYVGWHYLSDATCLMRPRLLYACFVVSRTNPLLHHSPLSKNTCVRQVRKVVSPVLPRESGAGSECRAAPSWCCLCCDAGICIVIVGWCRSVVLLVVAYYVIVTPLLNDLEPVEVFLLEENVPLPWMGWHYLASSTCLMRPCLLDACFVASGNTIMCYMIRHFWRTSELDK